MEKERRTKALLLSTLVVVVATLSIAFAAMSRTLNINGIGKMDTASWSVYFDDLSAANIVRGAQEVGKPKISDDKGTVQDINVKLSNPKDEISYTVDIVNDGTIDAEITMIKDIVLTDVQKKVFEFKVTYTDTGERLQNGDLLPKKTTKNITINIKFKDDITEFDLPTESQIINLSYQITYTQYDGGNIPIIPDGGEITTGKAVLAGNNMEEFMDSEDPFVYPFFNCTAIIRSQVESITFLNSNVVPAEYESNSWDASEAKDGTVIAWHTGLNENNLYNVYIGGNGGVYAPEDSSALFAMFVSLREINFNNNFDTSDVTNMSYMFSNSTSLINLELSTFYTTNVTDMSYMFVWGEYEFLNLISFDTSKVTNMAGMFSGCSYLRELDLSTFDTGNVTNMTYMFETCSSLTSLDVSNFDTSQVEDMSYMFAFCYSLISIDVSSFKIENETTVESMFSGCTSLTSIDFRNADFTNLGNYVGILNNVSASCQIIVKDETQRIWLTSKFTNLTNVVLPSEL